MYSLVNGSNTASQDGWAFVTATLILTVFQSTASITFRPTCCWLLVLRGLGWPASLSHTESVAKVSATSFTNLCN